jgi:hypothetical protein
MEIITGKWQQQPQYESGIDEAFVLAHARAQEDEDVHGKKKIGTCL